MSKDFFKFRESLLNEDIRKMSHSRLKFHATKNVPHGSYSRSEIEDEHERRKRTDGAEYAKAKATMNEEIELDEADTMYVIKHKKTKKVLNTHSDYNTAKDEHEGLGKDKHEYGVYKQTKKDAALRNRNTYREEVELDEKAYVSSLSPELGRKGSHDVIGKDGKLVKSYPYTKEGMKAAQAHLSKMKESVELDEVSDKKLDAYRQKAFADQPAGDDGSDKYRKRKFGRDLAFAKQTGRAKVLATKEEVELDEAAPKIKTDFVKTQREKDRAHDAAMGRTPTGRKKPARQMTSTQKSLASMRKEEVELDEAINYDKMSTAELKAAAHDAIKRGDRNAVKAITMAAQKKIANKGGTPVTKLTTDPKKLDALKKQLHGIKNEKVELDEVSASTLRNYVDKARADKSRQQKARTVAKNDYKKYGIPSDKERADAAHKKASQRNTGISMAKRKLGGYTKGTEPKVLAREEVELDEGLGHISAIQNMMAKEKEAQAKKKYTAPTQAEIDADRKKDQKGKPRPSMSAKSVTRKTYGNMMGGLKKEEVEQLDELSPNKLHAYIKGASKDLAKRSRMSGYDDKRGNYADGDKNRKRANKRMAGIASASGRMADKANMAEEYVNEKLKVSHGMGAWVDDFKKSDAPQFKGKSDKERRDMAVAAYLSAKRGQKEEYASDAQRKAVWASRAEKGKK